jgi:hypothetical protein
MLFVLFCYDFRRPDVFNIFVVYQHQHAPRHVPNYPTPSCVCFVWAQLCFQPYVLFLDSYTQRLKFEKHMYTCTVGRGISVGPAPLVDEPGQAGDDPDHFVAPEPIQDDASYSKCSDDVKLMLEFVESSVDEYAIITIPTLEGADQPFKAFQVLSKGVRNVLVKTYRSESVVPFKLRWQVQPFVIWRGSELSDMPDSLEVFEISDPLEVNIVEELGSNPEARGSLWKWTPADSDLAGCTRLVDRCVASPSCSLGDSKVPVLSLLDALDELKYIKVDRPVIHTKTSGLFFDGRNLLSKRAYLQAVLDSQRLFQKGVKEFRSGLSVAYYLALMKSPGPLPRNISTKCCQELLKALDPALAEALIGDAAPLPPAAPAQPLALQDLHISGDDEVPVAAIAGSSSSNDSSSSSSSNHAGQISGDDEADPYPNFLEGVAVVVERHSDRSDTGLRVQCQVHQNCELYRSCKLHVGTFGPRAAEYFLGTWLKRGTLERFPEKQLHKAWKPTVAEVREYIRELEQPV